jgi:hypothetical protein
LSVGPADGQLVYAAYDGTSSFAIVVDLASGRQSAVEPALVPHPRVHRDFGLEDPVWSPTSTTIAATRNLFGLELLDMAGTRRTVVDLGNYPIITEQAWSPDGETLAISVEKDNGSKLYFVDRATGTASLRLQRRRGRPYGMQWSPDGRWLGFTHVDG